MQYSFIKNSEEGIDLARIYKENLDLHYPVTIELQGMTCFIFKWEGVYKKALIRDFLTRHREGIFIPGYGYVAESAWEFASPHLFYASQVDHGPRFGLTTYDVEKCLKAFEKAYQKHVEKNRVTVTPLGVKEGDLKKWGWELEK